jgi:hypothetical protein
LIDWTIISAVVVAAIAAGGTVLVARLQNKGRPEHALIDQLQEEVRSLRDDKAKEMSEMKKDILELKDEQRKSRARELILADYINKLRRHIENGNPPPAPDWPAGVYD